MNKIYHLPENLQGPPGMHWLWKLVYGHGFWMGCFVAAFMTPILMIVLSTLWTGHILTWDEHFKSFIVGDPLLAVAVGILAILVRRENTMNYSPSKTYWLRWLVVGMIGSLLFILQEIHKGLLELNQLYQPHIFYHHILLISTYIPLLLGMAYIQYKRHPRSKLWIAFSLLLAGYLGLIIYDNWHPPFWV